MNRERPGRLRLLSFNIQAGADSQYYRHYLTRSWRQWLPHGRQMPNLNQVAHLVSQYDIVGLQEVDSGSLRSNFLDQTQYIALKAGFSGWHSQVNRNLGVLGQHSNGLLSRYAPSQVEAHRLPGNLPGRGVILALFGEPGEELAVCVLHLALGRRARRLQLDFVGELIQPYRYSVVMGDMNCNCQAPELVRLVDSAGLQEPACDEHSFPSWRPLRRIDHILVSDNLRVACAEVVNFPLSDHLPVFVEIILPPTLRLHRYD